MVDGSSIHAIVTPSKYNLGGIDVEHMFNLNTSRERDLIMKLILNQK